MNNIILVVLDTQGNKSEVYFEDYQKEELLLGRNTTVCDIFLQDNVVSKNHGCFRMMNQKVFYKDLGSRNGTFVEQQGSNVLLNQTNGYVEIHDQAVLRIGSIHEPDKMVLILCNISEQEESWDRYILDSTHTNIGRGKENEIVLNHPGVSKTHCSVEVHGDKYTLADYKSANGVLVNGVPVQESHPLNDKDIIQILDIRLIFSKTCIYYKTTNRGIRLEVGGISKVVGRGKKKKSILRNVSCEIKGNEFVAIIGGSGAGKSTLMNAISGYDQAFTGHVYCNGLDLLEQFQYLKNIIGYVPQQDIIYENLTLRKMLYYTAKMKMPDDTDQEEIRRRIDEVLKMIDLKEHESSFIRKLSGGQKKRASIAVELLADPKLFFLDEPTSGLDPGTEKSLMQTLNTLAKENNKTIVMVTHTTQNLHLCDKIIFMGPGGRLCFCGSVNQAKTFFDTKDLVNIYNLISEDPVHWQEKFSKVSNAEYKTNSNRKKQEVFKKKQVSRIKQFNVLFRRYVAIMKNDFQRILILLLQPFIIGILLYIVSDKDIFKIYESTKSMLFALSCSAIWIGLFNSIQEICKERVILKREYMANLKLPGYILSKFIVQAVLGFIQSVILTTIFLRLVNVDKAGIYLKNFQWEILFTVWLTVLAAISMGFLISSIVKTGDKAMAMAPFVLIVQLLFSGILFKLEGIGEKISYCTISRWSVEGLGSIAKLNKLDLKLQKDFPMLMHEAETVFKGSQGHLAKVWIILGVMIILCIIVSMVSLRRIAKDSR